MYYFREIFVRMTTARMLERNPIETSIKYRNLNWVLEQNSSAQYNLVSRVLHEYVFQCKCRNALEYCCYLSYGGDRASSLQSNRERA